MKCPACGLIVTQPRPHCRGCGFDISRLDHRFGPAPPATLPLWDEAELLSTAERESLTAALRAAAIECSGTFAIVTRRDTRPVTPAEYAFWLFNRWPVAPAPGRGLLVLVAVAERRVEIEMGSAWEAHAPDSLTDAWLTERAIPLLRAGRPAAALDDILAVARRALTPAPREGESS